MPLIMTAALSLAAYLLEWTADSEAIDNVNTLISGMVKLVTAGIETAGADPEGGGDRPVHAAGELSDTTRAAPSSC